MRGPECFRFYYHMYGSHVGSLGVSVQILGAAPNEVFMLWKMKGQQGNRWRKASIDIGHISGEFQVGRDLTSSSLRECYKKWDTHIEGRETAAKKSFLFSGLPDHPSWHPTLNEFLGFTSV